MACRAVAGAGVLLETHGSKDIPEEFCARNGQARRSLSSQDQAGNWYPLRSRFSRSYPPPAPPRRSYHNIALPNDIRRAERQGAQVLFDVVPNVRICGTDRDRQSEALLNVLLRIHTPAHGGKVFITGRTAPDIDLRGAADISSADKLSNRNKTKARTCRVTDIHSIPYQKTTITAVGETTTMTNLLRRLLGRGNTDNYAPKPNAVLETAKQAALHPTLYAQWGVPDTFDGVSRLCC